MAKVTVFKGLPYTKPISKNYKNTETQTPINYPAISNRVGKFVQIAASSPQTLTLYTVPAGIKARLSFALLWQIETGMAISLLIDGKVFYTRSGQLYSDQPLLNLPYEMSIEVRSNITAIVGGTTNPVSGSLIVIEDNTASVASNL